MTRFALVLLAVTMPALLLVSSGCSDSKAPQRSRNATINCWNAYRSILANHRAAGFDRYEGLDLKLAEMDTLFVDEELRKHIRWHIDWIKDMRRSDGSPLDVLGNLADRGLGGAFDDANKVGAKVADFKQRCQSVRAALSEKYDVVFDQLTSYGPLPVLK